MDVFMNFVTITGEMDLVNTSLPTEAELFTGLTVALGLAWQVHRIDLTSDATIGDAGADSQKVTLAGRSIHGGTKVMSYVNPRVLGYWNFNSLADRPRPIKYLPPVLFAAHRLYLTMETYTGHVAALAGQTYSARIGFTTIKLPDRKFIELAQTWELVA